MDTERLKHCRRRRNCFICGYGDEDTTYFSFPKISKPEIRNEWIKFANVDPTVNVSNLRLCHRHFAANGIKLIEGKRKRSLLENAIPTLLPEAETTSTEQNKPKTWRCVLCGYKKVEDQFLRHRFPKAVGLRKKWLDFCGKSSDEITDCHRVCQLHFTENDYTVSWLTKNKRRLVLKASAIPSIRVPASRSRHRCILCEYNGNDVTYHNFPNDVHVTEQWLVACELGEMEKMNRRSLDRLRVCSRHFADTDFEDDVRHKLKTTAVPSLHLSVLDDGPGNNYKHVTRTASTTVTTLSSTESNASECIPVQETDGVSQSSSSNKRVADSCLNTGSAKRSKYMKETRSVETSPVNSVTPSREENSTTTCEVIDVFTPEVSPIADKTRSVDDASSGYSTANTTVTSALTPKARYTFVGDFASSDVETPGKAKRFLHIAKKTITEKNNQLRSQRKKIKKLDTQVDSLKDMIQELAETSLIEDNAARIMQTRSELKLQKIPHPSKYCCVPGCKRSCLDGPMHYFKIKKLELNLAWLKAINREDLIKFNGTTLRSRAVCDNHFSPKQRFKATCKVRTDLIDDAVPDLNLPSTSVSPPQHQPQTEIRDHSIPNPMNGATEQDRQNRDDDNQKETQEKNTDHEQEYQFPTFATVKEMDDYITQLRSHNIRLWRREEKSD